LRPAYGSGHAHGGLPNPRWSWTGLAQVDVDHAVFVTAASALKWGASLSGPMTSSRPEAGSLQPYDLRLGADMLKLEAPLSAAKTNLYAVALFDNPEAPPPRPIGGAFRVEARPSAAPRSAGRGHRPAEPRLRRESPCPGASGRLCRSCHARGDSFSTYERALRPQPGASLGASYSIKACLGCLQASAGLNMNSLGSNARHAGRRYFYNELGATAPSFTHP